MLNQLNRTETVDQSPTAIDTPRSAATGEPEAGTTPAATGSTPIDDGDYVDRTSLELLGGLFGSNRVVELRALAVRVEGRTEPTTLSAYFETARWGDLMEAACELSGCARGVYVTLNPLPRELLARTPCGIPRRVAGSKDCEVVSRTTLLLDFDPVRAADASATEAEKAAALVCRNAVREFLGSRGWPSPVHADSGNGYHDLYRIDLPSDDGGLVKSVLTALATRFDTPWVTIDRQVYNAARIGRLYGTMACKGVETAERPHRRSRILRVPAEWRVVDRGLLEELAAEVSPAPVNRAGGCAAGAPDLAGKALANVLQRATAYLAKVPPAVAGQGGDKQTFVAACVLVQRFGLTPEQAYPLMAAWNTKCVPPWGDDRLWYKLREAAKQPGQRGRLLLAEPAAPADGGAGPDPTGSGVEAVSDHADDPHRLARAFLRARFRDGSGLRLRYWKGTFWVWHEGYYRLMPHDSLRAEAVRMLPALVPAPAGGSKGIKVTQTLVTHVIGALAGEVLVSDLIDQPAWVGPAEGTPGCDTVALRNGLLRLRPDGTAAGLRSATPDWFSPICLPMDYVPTAACPKWLAFLGKNLEGDADRIGLLQEFFGYCLLPDTSRQRFLMLEGDGSNGKSVVCAALAALLGPRNVSHVPLEAFDQRFALHTTLGKLANIASEVGELDRAAEGLLKAFTAGDRMMFDRKGLPPIEAMPTARCVLATNNRPRFSDKTGGLWRRMILLSLDVKIAEDERVYGMDKPDWWGDQGELSGLLNWALAGLVRLRSQNRFTEPAACTAALDQYRAECNPVGSFLHEYCQSDPESSSSTSELYERYVDWSKSRGYAPVNDGNFGKEVKRKFPDSRKGRSSNAGSRHYSYTGIKYAGPHRFTASY